MVSFENFVKSMPPSLSKLKVTPSLSFPFKIPDDPTATTTYIGIPIPLPLAHLFVTGHPTQSYYFEVEVVVAYTYE